MNLIGDILHANKRTILALAAAALGGAGWFVLRKSDGGTPLEEMDPKTAAVAEATSADTATAVASGGQFQARLTGYWPFTASASERQMEGGANDRKGKPLHTLEDFQAGKAPYVAVSGDDAIFPYGQRLSIDEWPGVVFRVVDTGGHFRGKGKVYRDPAREPLDICVDSSKTKVIPNATAQIVKGDHFDTPGKEVALSKFQGQTVAAGDDQAVAVGGLELLGAKWQ